jgi:hypothetical protein
MNFAKLITIGLLGCGAALVACDSTVLLEVEDPDVALPEALRDTTNLAAVRGLGVGDFQVAFGGASTTEGLVAITGIMSDELFHSGTFLPNREMDRREINVTNTGVTTVFRALHRARRSTDIAAETFQTARGDVAEAAELRNLHAYTYVFFAENWCSGVPVSTDAEGVFTFGLPLSTAELLTTATTNFDEALATATNSTPQQYVARIGKARVLLNQEKFAEAAVLVQGIPTTFRYQMQHSDNTTRQNNGIFGITQTRREYGISHLEGGNGLPFRQSPADPRVPWTRDAGAADASIRQYTPRKYDSRLAPIDLASGVEARLIEAEAALSKGTSAGYLTILNALRVNLPPLTDPGTPGARVDQFFRERAFWLYAQGHRLSDLRRLVRQYGRTQAQVFPTGPYVLEGTDGNLRPAPSPYGTDVNFPVPVDELNNPNFTQCASRGA